jgi:hypothetical protein
MTTSTLDHLTQRHAVADRSRAIGPAGTAARILLPVTG